MFHFLGMHGSWSSNRTLGSECRVLGLNWIGLNWIGWSTGISHWNRNCVDYMAGYDQFRTLVAAVTSTSCTYPTLLDFNSTQYNLLILTWSPYQRHVTCLSLVSCVTSSRRLESLELWKCSWCGKVGLEKKWCKSKLSRFVCVDLIQI